MDRSRGSKMHSKLDAAVAAVVAAATPAEPEEAETTKAGGVASRAEMTACGLRGLGWAGKAVPGGGWPRPESSTVLRRVEKGVAGPNLVARRLQSKPRGI